MIQAIAVVSICGAVARSRDLRLRLSRAPFGRPRTAHVMRFGSAAHRSFAALRAASLLLIAIVYDCTALFIFGLSHYFVA